MFFVIQTRKIGNLDTTGLQTKQLKILVLAQALSFVFILIFKFLKLEGMTVAQGWHHIRGFPFIILVMASQVTSFLFFFRILMMQSRKWMKRQFKDQLEVLHLSFRLVEPWASCGSLLSFVLKFKNLFLSLRCNMIWVNRWRWQSHWTEKGNEFVMNLKASPLVRWVFLQC